MKLPVRQEFDCKLVVYVFCGVVGWVSVVCTGEDEIFSGMKKIKELCSICREKVPSLQKETTRLKSEITFSSFFRNTSKDVNEALHYHLGIS